MATWSERLAQRLEELGWTAVVLAKRSGVPEQSVYKYLQHRTTSPRGNVIKKLADAVGVSEVWLMHGDALPNENHVAVTRVPLIKLDRFVTGGVMDLPETLKSAGEFVPVPDEPPISKKALACRVDDDAISRAPRGAIVVVDPDRPPEPGRYVLAYSSIIKRAVVRRWRATDYSGAGQLVADNPDYPPLPMSAADDGYIIGRVVLVVIAEI